MARNYSNTTVETTLVNSINSSQTTMEINDVGGLPVTFPYSLVLDPEGSSIEVVTVTNFSGGTHTITRGQDGTAASSHDAGTVVIHGVTARDLKEPQDHIDASAEVHGLDAGSDLVGTTDTQTLTNKTISGASNTLTSIPGSALASPFSAGTVDATFDALTATSLVLTDPDPDVNVATTLAGLRTDVDANAGNITTNATNISTNASDIATNAGDITALDDRVTDLETPEATRAGGTANLTGLSNTTYAAGSPAIGISFTAPPTGRVLLLMFAHIDLHVDSTNDREAFVALRVGTGSTQGSGTALNANGQTTPSDEDSLRVASPEGGATRVSQSGTVPYIVVGLTPGNSYNAQVQHRLSATSGGFNFDVLRREIQVVPLP